MNCCLLPCRQRGVVGELVAVGLEFTHLLAVSAVVELQEAVVAKETGTLWSQLIVTRQPCGTPLAHTAWVVLDLGPERQARVLFLVQDITPGVEQSDRTSNVADG